uniref:NADH dehydrogenase [ubiquinone] 1 beta subcomplex subunit 5, mitochondrial n=1 Tax=Saccoglossus kowalevskii TaxID=10224 RepID=A0ABM0GTI5_SACKO|nr:PREDICTED: NADH dehydrogenase [ubiquinone] 1 beta subcomplex subunit 5, mitochondrial-like [Saccoglossus kowalevskii]
MAAAGLLSRFLQVSRLRVPLQRANLILQQPTKNALVPMIGRGMSGGAARRFEVRPSKYVEKRLWRMVGFYTMLTALPAAVVITYINVFIGEAKLTEIPEGYEPEHWEYHQHPITRWLARYVVGAPQKEYEKFIDYLEIENEKKQLRSQEKQVRRMMRQHGDGHWYYYPTPSPDVYDDKS